MKTVIFSDSHGNTKNMVKIIENICPDHIIHLGDFARDAELIRDKFPNTPMHYVVGNCDYSSSAPESDIFELEGVRFFIAHGHRHNVKMNMDSFINSVYFSGAKIGLYGHTHRARWQEIKGVTIINPGACGDSLHPTYGLIETNSGEINYKILDII